MSPRLARELAPWLFDGDILWLDNEDNLAAPAFYSCRNFNLETRECTSHDDLPETCAGYPWYEGKPQPGKMLSPHCSYNADVGQPVELTRKPGT